MNEDFQNKSKVQNEGEKLGWGGQFSASRVWYVAGRCRPLKRCHDRLTRVSPSHPNTLPGPERKIETSELQSKVTDLQAWRKISLRGRQNNQLDCRGLSFLWHFRGWWVQRTQPASAQTIPMPSSRGWGTTRRPSWLSGGRSPKQNGTLERRPTDVTSDRRGYTETHQRPISQKAQLSNQRTIRSITLIKIRGQHSRSLAAF